jgi:peptide-methionine (S)-S-oxide reductase
MSRTLLLAALLTAAPPIDRPAERTAVFAGGCYWGVESVFEHVRGVKSAVSGFAFADTTFRSPEGESPRAGHAEAVRVVYDPARVTYEQLLQIFFAVAHDPTQRDRQGPDVGSQYRSVVFTSSDDQREAARAHLTELSTSGSYANPIATEIAPLREFRPVGASQQDYAARNPTEPYVLINDAPKIEALRRRFPALYRREETERR